MDLYIYLIIGFVISIFSFAVFTILRFSKRKKLSKEKKDSLNKLFKEISLKNSTKEKIIDYDKLYHKVLLEMGYNGTFGEILKLEPNEIGDLQKVWELHKLRNKLVHDFDLIDESHLKKREKEYKEELKNLLD
ncbi:MAG: hypothetical protein PHI37_05055 [Candidatus Gracilibacteria bacterium]|nr:hypothetical protein [Candidatus Gracilibacteria bacterium]